MPEHHELPTPPRPSGSLLDGAGYRSSYIGKWHLSHSPTRTWRPTASPTGTATTATSWGGPAPASTSTRSSPPTPPTGSTENAGPAAGPADRGGQPWFLTVALVNPHDVMWFPVDQPGYAEHHPDDVAAIRAVLESAAWKDDDPLPVFTEPYPEVVDRLPANFDDDLHTKPEAHRQWRWDQQHGLWGYIDPADTGAWLRHLDYYVHLHQLADRSLGTVLAALEALGGLGRHRRHLHLRPRRHVRLPRAALQGPVRLRRDHAGAPLREGPRASPPRAGHRLARLPRRPGRHHLRAGRGRSVHRRRPTVQGADLVAGAGRPGGLGPGPHPVRPGLGPDHRPQQRPLRPAGLLRRTHQVRPLLRGGRGQAVDRTVGQATGPQALRRGLRLRRQRPRVVRPRRGPARTGQSGQRPLAAGGAAATTTSACAPTSGSRSSPSGEARSRRRPHPWSSRPADQVERHQGCEPRQPASTRSRQRSKSASSP